MSQNPDGASLTALPFPSPVPQCPECAGCGSPSFLSADGPKTMTARDQDEYIALRATIRERGTARVCIFASGMAAWAAASIATAALASSPVATLLPLLLLAAIFEAVFALHIGVERIGRYLQVFHEADPSHPPGPPGLPAPPVPRGWEHVAMAFGRPKGAASVDALFTVIFFLAALFNVVPALLLEPQRVELIFVGGAHALFALRLLVARHAASTQRTIDLARLEQLKNVGT
jgi:hypothetical protein